MITAIELTIDSETPLDELVLAAQAGEREAFGELAARFERSVYAIAMRRLGNHAEAQEIVQDVFVQVLRKIEQLREPAAVGGWIRQIAERLSLNRLVRGGGYVSAEPEMFDSFSADEVTPLSTAIGQERAAQVRAGLDRLKQLDRETLTSFYVDGSSLAEMSAKFDSPIGTIKRRLHVARKRLARELEELAT